MDAINLLVSDSYGWRIPARFSDLALASMDLCGGNLYGWAGVTRAELEICADTSNPDYWEVWDDILQNVRITRNGNTWRLWQDGGLFAVCEGLMSSQEREEFFS
jgi:hypothetical protein